MSIESYITTRLEAVAGVTALIGSGDSARIYPFAASQGAARPYVTYHRISSEHAHDMAGISGLEIARMQIDVWADKKSEAIDVAEQVRLALSGFRGTVDSTNIRKSHLLSINDTDVPPASGDEKPVYRRTMDFSISAFEATS